jgi:streptomycin 6-kinase
MDWDDECGALLLKRIRPATPLPPGDEENAIRAATTVLSDLHAVRLSVDHPFPEYEEWIGHYRQRVMEDAEPDAIGVPMLETALSAARRLSATARNQVLLHGDFIDKNLRLGRDGYIAIDPMPWVGDPCADVGAFAAEHPPARRITMRARALAGALGYDPDRAARWAAVYSVGLACETWRDDSDELAAWVSGPEAAHQLSC